MTKQFDVIIATDLRFPGGSGSSTIEEIRAQHRFGMRTGLIQLPSTRVGQVHPFHPGILELIQQEAAELIAEREPVQADILIIRHPTVLHSVDRFDYEVSAAQRIIVANHVPSDGDDIIYDVPACDRLCTQHFGTARWYPIGPLVRERLTRYARKVDLADEDWVNIIDVEGWARDHSEPRSSIPVLGRHSRDHWMKWPSKAEDILAAYPADGSVEVKILGGIDSAIAVLGHDELPWTVYPFRSRPASDFLAELDFFVYFHHELLQEAFGRAIFEALAAGVVSIVPHHFEPLFGPACLYADAKGAQSLVHEYHGNREKYRAQSELGQDFVREHFSYETHRARLERLRSTPTAARSARTRVRVAPRRRPHPFPSISPRLTIGRKSFLDATKAGVIAEHLPAPEDLHDEALLVWEKAIAQERLSVIRAYADGERASALTATWSAVLADELKRRKAAANPSRLRRRITRLIRPAIASLPPGSVIGRAWRKAIPLPVILFDGIDAAEEDIPRAVRAIRELERARYTFRAAILLPASAAIHELWGPYIEYLPDRAAWERGEHGLSWDAYCELRIRALMNGSKGERSLPLHEALRLRAEFSSPV